MNVLTALRHVMAVLAAWLVTTLLGRMGLNVGPDQIATLTEAVTVLGMVVMLAVYALMEKWMKPWFRRRGEPQAPVSDPRAYYYTGPRKHL